PTRSGPCRGVWCRRAPCASSPSLRSGVRAPRPLSATSASSPESPPPPRAAGEAEGVPGRLCATSSRLQLFFLGWQLDRERGTLAGEAFDADPAMVLLDDLAADAQPQAGPAVAVL